MRLIDADAFDKALKDAQTECKKNGGNFRFGVLGKVRANLALFPTVDRPEIVRCNDCKHGSLYCTEDVCGETLIECNRPDLGDVIEIHGWNWFCADGERRE